MPTVWNKHYSYTKSGMTAAAKAADTKKMPAIVEKQLIKYTGWGKPNVEMNKNMDLSNKNNPYKK